MQRLQTILITTCVFLLLFITIETVDSQQGSIQVVRSEGVGTIIKEDRVHARDAAINNALRTAVEQSVGVVIHSETIIQNFQTISDNIYTKARGFVAGYKIIEEKAEVNVIKVTLDVNVIAGKIVDTLIDLNFLQNFIHKPRIMVIIPERHLRRVIPDPAGETDVIRKFVEEDFWVVDQNQVEKIRELDQAKRAAQGDNAAAAALGRQFKAEIIIVGEAFSQLAEDTGLGGLFSCRARLEARAIHCDTGQIIAAHGVHAPGLEITEELASKKALAEAGGKFADYMMKEIIRKWAASAVQGTSVTLKITNVTFKQLVLLEKSLKEEISVVKGFHRRHFASTGKIAEIEVDLKGDTQQFSTEVVLKEFPDFEIEVTNVTAKTVDVRFKPKEKAIPPDKNINIPLKPNTVIAFERIDKAGANETRRLMIINVQTTLLECRWEFYSQTEKKIKVWNISNLLKSHEYCMNWGSLEKNTTSTEPWVSMEVFDELKQVGMTLIVVDKYVRKDSIVMAELKQNISFPVKVNGINLSLQAIEVFTDKGDKLVILDSPQNPLVLSIDITGMYKSKVTMMYVPGYKP